MLPQEGPLKTLFLGWSLDGKTAVNPLFVPDHAGRQVLVPLPLAELDANQEISWQQDFDENSFAYLEYVQTLTGLVQPAEQLSVSEMACSGLIFRLPSIRFHCRSPCIKSAIRN